MSEPPHDEDFGIYIDREAHCMKVDLRKFKATRYPKGLPFEVEEEDWEKIHEIPLRPGSTLREGWYRLEHAQNAKAVLVAIFGVPRKAGPCVLCNNSKPSSRLNFTNCLVFSPKLARLANQKDNTCCNCIWRHNYDQCCDVKGNAKRSGSARLLQELQPDRGFHSPDPRESTRASDTSRKSRGLTEEARDDDYPDDEGQPSTRERRRHAHKDSATKPHIRDNSHLSNFQLANSTPPSSRPSLGYQELHRGRGGPPVPRTAIWEKSPTDDDKNLLTAVAIVCNKHAINTKTDVDWPKLLKYVPFAHKESASNRFRQVLRKLKDLPDPSTATPDDGRQTNGQFKRKRPHSGEESDEDVAEERPAKRPRELGGNDQVEESFFRMRESSPEDLFEDEVEEPRE